VSFWSRGFTRAELLASSDFHKKIGHFISISGENQVLQEKKMSVKKGLQFKQEPPNAGPLHFSETIC